MDIFSMQNFDWHTIFISDFSWQYALEILVRTLLMFSFILLILRMSGKKGARQLSIFEVAIIIALGSAAGDPMFNQDIAILPALTVFAVILSFYRVLTYFASKNEKIEGILEGDPIYIIEEGEFVMQERTDHNFARDEFFAEMRLQNIEHLGQVKTAILETNGQVSFFYFDDQDVKHGLPVLPKEYNKKTQNISKKNHYACTYCGKVDEISFPSKCSRCEHQEWVPAIRTRRLT
ncbi:DUF421 domain-containing protein [Pedobacter sp. PWIIR3]